MSDKSNKSHGFRIYRERERVQSDKASKLNHDPYPNGAKVTNRDQQMMEINFLLKKHANTLVVGLLMYKGELKGVRFYDSVNRKFIDIAPWHLSKFSISKLKIMGVREIELIRHEAGNAPGTLVVEFLSKHEIRGQFRAVRMVSDNLASALSGITAYMSDEEYNNVLRSFSNEA